MSHATLDVRLREALGIPANLSLKILQATLPPLAQSMVSSKIKIETVTDPESWGATDGNTIKICAPLTLDSTLRLAAASLGLVHHEVGHCNHTQFDDLRTMHARKVTPVVKSLVNLIEDVRQELLHIRAYPGSQQRLDALGLVALDANYYGDPSQWSPVAAVLNWLHASLRIRWRDQPDYQVIRDKAVLPAAVESMLQPYVDRFEQLTSTADVIRVAEEITDKLRLPRQTSDERTTQAQQSKPSDKADNAASDRSSAPSPNQGQEADDSQSEDDQEMSASSPAGSDDTEPKDDAGTGAKSDEESSDNQGSNQAQGSPAPLGNEEAKASATPCSGKGSDPSASSESQEEETSGSTPSQEQVTHADQNKDDAAVSENDEADVPKGFSPEELIRAMDEHTPQDGIDGIKQILRQGSSHSPGESQHVSVGADGMAQSGRLTQRVASSLTQRLITESYSRRPACSGTRLNTKALTAGNHLTGGDRLFLRSRHARAPDAAVIILRDISGSMLYSKDPASAFNPLTCRGFGAATAAAVLHRAINSIQGCTCATMCFPDGPIVSFGQTLAPAFATIVGDARAGTPTDEAYQAAGWLLGLRSEPRKLVVLITDGAPNDPIKAKRASTQLANDGIEELAIGIETSIQPHTVSERTQCVRLDAIDELPRLITNLVFDRLFGVSQRRSHAA
jgi:cobaltochelatase CobT